MQVFISHNSRDKDVARLLAAFIRQNDVVVWFDEWNLSAGDSLVGKISEGLDGSTHVVVVWSKNAKTSKWVTQEFETALYRAIEGDELRVIPVVLDDTPLPTMLASRVWRAADNENERNQRLWNLAREIAGKGPADDWLKDFVRQYGEIWKVYNSEVLEGGQHPFGYKACPECGSKDLKSSGGMAEHKGYSIAWAETKCPDCGFKESGEPD